MAGGKCRGRGQQTAPRPLDKRADDRGGDGALALAHTSQATQLLPWLRDFRARARARARARGRAGAEPELRRGAGHRGSVAGEGQSLLEVARRRVR